MRIPVGPAEMITIVAILLIVGLILWIFLRSRKKGLVPCVDCGRKISVRASFCPGCGRKSSGGLWVALIVGIVVAVVIGVLVFMGAKVEKKRIYNHSKPDSYRSVPKDYGTGRYYKKDYGTGSGSYYKKKKTTVLEGATALEAEVNAQFI